MGTVEPEVERVYSLEEAAREARVSLRLLTKECRAGLVEHFRKGRSRGMTARQINAYIAANSGRGKPAEGKPKDEFAQIRESSLKGSARSRRRAA